jgi:hypothetical protein
MCLCRVEEESEALVADAAARHLNFFFDFKHDHHGYYGKKVCGTPI